MVKKSLLAVALMAVLAVSASPVAFAQTPDGETPVNEGVCDELLGATPGLYGLCVAFCEAQDHADVSEPITDDELEALSDSAPAGRILENYNERKQAGDPDMPCIKIAEPCPCWSSAEADAVAASRGTNAWEYCHRWNGPWHNGAYILGWTNVSNDLVRLFRDRP